MVNLQRPEPLFLWLMAVKDISITSQDSRSADFRTQELDLPRAPDLYRAPSNDSQPSTAILDGPPFFRTDPICSTSLSQCGSSPYVDQPGSVPSYGQGPVATASNDHLHWCVVCDDPREIKTCDGFKRHMREHETRFYCMLKGPVVDTEKGPKCAFCNVLHPDPEHLGTHNVHLCMNKSPADRSYSRKELLTKHLKRHGIVEAAVLADQWRYTANKKYFACGFCGSYHDSLVEQINHIDVVHYTFSENINDWDSNKAIRGLLSQPGMRDCWRTLLAANPYLQESSLTWTPTLAKKLQLRLEQSEETAEILFTAAIDQSNYGRRDDPQMASSQSTQTLSPRPLWSPLPSILDHDSITDVQTLPLTASHLQSQQLAQDQAIESTISKHHRHSGSPTRTRLPSNSGEDVMQLPLSFYAPSSAQTLASRTQPVYTSGFGGISSVISPSLASSTYPRRGAEAFTIPVQAPTSSFDTTLAIQHTPWAWSPNHPRLQLDQVNSSFATADHQMQFARPQDHLDDSSNSNMQRIAQDKVCRRRRR